MQELEHLYPIIKELTIEQWRQIFTKHLAWAVSVESKPYHGRPYWRPDNVNTITIRFNGINDFYERRKAYVEEGDDTFNDRLVMIDTLHEQITIFNCTADPARIWVNRRGIAHLLPGVYQSYVRGYHKGIPWRKALKQVAPVLVHRTDEKGNFLHRDRGNYGMNVHNQMGLFRPSAGCTVYEAAGGVMGINDPAQKLFTSILYGVPSTHDYRSYALLEHGHFQSYIQTM